MEPIGGWLGRVAARYRMGVSELAHLYGLELDFDRPGNAWLIVGRIGQATIRRLTALARVDAAVLHAMQEWRPEPNQQPRLAYCRSCLFLNPLDVTSPCWKREWMNAMSTVCAIHAKTLSQLPITSLRRCDNFDHLLRVVSHRERTRRVRRR
jgi:hypothetical protein